MSNRIGRYDIRSRLGSGAFATVFEAFDPRLESTVAIKLLADNWIHEPDVRARFRQEAVLLRRVQTEHPSAPLLDVYDIDETEDGRPYFVMRLADRGSLAERSTPGTTWAADAVVPIVDMLEQALTTLHRAGIVHRDVKPSNLLVTSSRSSTAPGTLPPDPGPMLVAPDERVLLGDLGLAKDQLISSSALTVAGGTPRFMAPEQRDPAAPIDHRADLFAATVVVVDLITGSPTHPTETSGLSAEAVGLFTVGMSPNPSDRYADAASWAAAMRRALQPVASAPVAGSEAVVPPPPRMVGVKPRPLAPKVVGAVLALLLLGAAVIVAVTQTGDGLIEGPREVTVGDQVTLSADVGDDDRYVWRVGGREVADLDLVLAPDRAGFIEVQLDITRADGTTSQTIARVVVKE